MPYYGLESVIFGQTEHFKGLETITEWVSLADGQVL